MCMRYTSVYSTEMAELQHTKEVFTGQDAKDMWLHVSRRPLCENTEGQVLL